MPRSPTDQAAAERADRTTTSVLFVCTGNICRSPMAEVVLRALAERTTLADGRALSEALVVGSAGTSRWHEGAEMDPRARRALDAAGFPGRGPVARQVSAELLERTDVVVALDRGHRRELVELDEACAPTLLRSHAATGEELDVADPYYGDDEEFDACLAQVVEGCEALARDLAARLA